MRLRLFAMRSALMLGALGCAVPAAAQNGADDPLVRARSLAQTGKLSEAEAVLRDCVQRQPDSAAAHFLLGYVLFREEKARESLAEFTAGARTRRPAADDFRVIASDYVLLGDYSDAAKWFSEVTKEKPGDAEGWYLLGRAQYSEGRYPEAVASFQHALELRQRYVEAENNLGLAWQALDKRKDATTAFQTAVGWEGADPVDAQPYLNLGSALTEENHADQAVRYLRVAAGLAPNNPKVHEELARAYEEMNQLAEAQGELEKATALAPKASGLHFKLGRIYRREGLRDQAQREFDICAKLDSTHSSVSTPNPYSPD